MRRSAAVIIAALLCLLCFAGAVSATELITDGDFSDTSGSGFTYWTVTTIPEAASSTSTNYARIYDTSGSGVHFMLSAQAESSTSPATSFAGISQMVNLNNADKLTFKTKKGSSYNIYQDQTLILYIIKGSEVVGSYTFNNLGSTSSWTEQTVDLTAFYDVGYAKLQFSSSVVSESNTVPTMVDFYLTDVSAIESKPVLSSASISGSNVIQPNTQVSLTYSYTASPAGGSYSYICWGDSDYYNRFSGLTGTQSHTYTTPGTYQIKTYASNALGSSSESTVATIEVVTLAFDVYGSASGNAPFTAEFTYTASSNLNVLSWNFGDGQTSVSTTNPTVHTYTGTGVYSVSLTGTTALGRQISVSKSNLISTESQSVSFGASEYSVGNPATVSWSIRNPDFTNHNYYIYIYPAVSDGTRSSQNSVYTYQIPNAQTNSTTWNTTGIPGGYYSAYLYQDNSDLTHSSPAVSLVSYVTLTVNLAAAGTSYTNSTTVSILQNGATKHSLTTTSGVAVFNSVATGTYQVQAVTTGYATQTATVVLAESSSITIDFVTGTTDDTSAGMGSQYAASYVTFRCYDSGTGKPLSGVTVNVVGVEATNPIEWMANLFGSAWGSKIIGTNLSGVSDDNGVVTFAMVPNVRYQIHIIYGDYTADKVFQPSTLTGEYPLELDITKWDTTNKFSMVVTSVTATEDKKIISNYTDTTASTQALNVSLYEVVDTSRVYITSQSAVSNSIEFTFSPESPSGKSYIITVNATTSQLGKITREYAVDFNGPRILLGSLPDNFYIVISFLLLAMVGAVGTMVTSRMYCLVVVVVAAFLWYAGWLFALGTIGSVVLLLCFVLAIIYYIASKAGGGD